MMATTETVAICLWLDETSDTEWSAWVVSRDTLGERNKTLTTDTLRFWRLDEHDDAYEQAKAAALELGRKDGLPVYEGGLDGEHDCILSAELAAMMRTLERHGERFTGVNVDGEAQEWIDRAFDAETADPWCEIGVWDASTAAELRDASLTPEQVAIGAERLLDDAQDEAADSFTDGDPIYSVCNADTDIQDLIDAARGA